MKVLNYKHASARIAWERARTLDAQRDRVLSAVVTKLRQFKPNSPSNIKHPWKLSDRFTARAWCPLHDGRWVKLIVRVAEDGHVTFECAAGCSQQQVRTHIGILGDDSSSLNCQISSSPDSAMGAGAHRQSDRGSRKVLDARRRFESQRKRGGSWESDFTDDPAA